MLKKCLFPEVLRMSLRPPVIGITLDYEETPSYSKMPWYALRENYCSAVSRLGAIPLPLPHEVELIPHYLNLIDGLMITGGAFDVSPALYGDSSIHETVTLKERRTKFEWGITQGCVDAKKPILGICGGEQLLNVILGGTLIQHIPDSINDALEHEQKNPRTEPGHEVLVKENTLLHKIVGKTKMSVNTAHHQAVGKPAPGALVNSTTTDGVIEGIEFPAHPFCLGVQWHPEYHVDSSDNAIFEAFVKACSRN
jgi:putative glutamine amidotransferase